LIWELRDIRVLPAGARKTRGFQVPNAPPGDIHYAAMRYWAASSGLACSVGNKLNLWVLWMTDSMKMRVIVW